MSGGRAEVLGLGMRRWFRFGQSQRLTKLIVGQRKILAGKARRAARWQFGKVPLNRQWAMSGRPKLSSPVEQAVYIDFVQLLQPAIALN
jgi:hypothetical protein